MVTDISIETRRFGNIDNIFDCSVMNISKDLAQEYISEMGTKLEHCNSLVESFIETDFTDYDMNISKHRVIGDLEYMKRRIAFRKLEYGV